MRRKCLYSLVILLLLYIVPVNLGPSSDGPAIVFESQLAPSEDESSGILLAVAGDGEVTLGSGDHESTWLLYVHDSEVYEYRDTAGPPYISWVELVFSVGLPADWISFDINFVANTVHPTDLEVYNFDTSSWTNISEFDSTAQLSWYNLTDFSIEHCLNSTEHFRIRYFSNSSVSTTQVSIDYCEIVAYANTPLFVSTWINPPQPDDAEAVTFTVLTSFLDSEYNVTINALIHPNGFSDVDYEMIVFEEYTTWTYTFESLIAGYYLFEITVTDGDQTAEDIIPLAVLEGAIVIIPISFIGAGPDFTGIQFSFDCNRAGDLSITEWTAVNESYATDAAETQTGTVIDGLNNIFWEKLETEVSTVYFNFTITSGIYETNWTSTYQVAQTTFYVERCNDNGEDFSEDVTVTGRITKLATYTVYIDNVEGSNGTLTSLDFVIEFDKKDTNAAREAWHTFAVKFTNGSQTCWYNSTFYLWKNDPDQPKGGGVVMPFGPDFWLKLMIAGSIVAVLGIVINKTVGGGDLPNQGGN